MASLPTSALELQPTLRLRHLSVQSPDRGSPLFHLQPLSLCLHLLLRQHHHAHRPFCPPCPLVFVAAHSRHAAGRARIPAPFVHLSHLYTTRTVCVHYALPPGAIPCRLLPYIYHHIAALFHFQWHPHLSPYPRSRSALQRRPQPRHPHDHHPLRRHLLRHAYAHDECSRV